MSSNQQHGETHTAKMLRAAQHIAADVGCTPEQGQTIIGAALDKLTLEEKWELARKMEEESEDRVDDQT